MTEHEAIALEVIRLLDERRTITEHEHSDHHEIIRTLIPHWQAEKEALASRKELRTAVIKHVLGWGIVGLITALGALMYRVFAEWIHRQ